ncbi:MAG: YfhO family protein [Streptococcus salivarius]
MSNAGVYRADVDQIQQVLENRKKQGLHVTKFSNTHIVGDVSITDDSNYMMTSIPYSDGWKVKVDGKFVKTEKAWNAFLSFPISREIIRLNSSLDKRSDPGCLAIYCFRCLPRHSNETK